MFVRLAFLEASRQDEHMDDFYPEFGRRIRLARRRAYLSQAALGRLMGMNRTSITSSTQSEPGRPSRRPTMRKTDLAAQRLLSEANFDAAPVDVFALAKLA